MKKHIYFEVSTDTGEDGRGPIKYLGNFSQESDAETYAVGRGNYRQTATVSKKTVVIFQNLDEAEDYSKERQVEKALEKLTNKEIELLKEHILNKLN